jgi:hypothetical protein
MTDNPNYDYEQIERMLDYSRKYGCMPESELRKVIQEERMNRPQLPQVELDKIKNRN